MPDIGVLSIQIKSDASQAAQSLKDLAGALRSIEKIVGQATSGLSSFASSLKAVEKAVGESKGYLTLSRIATSIEKVKTASQGFKTPDFSRLESLMRALQDNFNAENGLKRMAEGMEAIKAASQGFTMPNMKGIEKVIAAMNAPVQTGNANAGKEAVGNISETMPASFETATSQVQQIISDSTDLITTNTGLAANNMQQQFSESFGMIASDAKQAADDATETMRNIGTGTADIVPASAVTEGRVSFDNLREGAIEVEGTVSESLNNIAGYLNGAVQNAAEGSNAVRGYLTGIVEEMKKVEQEAANVQEAVRPEGYGTKASIREIYASTEYGNKLRGTPGPTNFGEALRGELGQNAKYETVKQVAGGTGLTEAEVIHQLVELGKEARKSKAEIDQLIESLNKPIDYGNLSQGVDRMLGIGAAAKSAAESASAFTSAPAAQQIQELMDALNRPIDYGNLSQGIDRMMGIGSAAKSAAESASAFTSVPAAQQIQELVDALNQPIDWKNLSQGIDRMQGIGAEAKSAEDSMRAFLEAMGESSPQAESLRELNPELNRFKQEMDEAGMNAKDFTSNLVDVDGELKQKKPDAEEAASAFSRFKDAVNNVKKAIKGSWLGKLGRQFASIAKRMAIRAIIKQITSAFREGTENVYHYSEAIGSSLAPAMDQTASLLKQMKNSIGAAIAPAIQAVLPYINQLVNAFIDAINWVNQFFALLNGQTTWTKALAVDAKAFEDQQKSAKGASNAVKDMLADWDELNIIQQQGGSGGSGSGNKTEDYTTMFTEESNFGEGVKNIVGFIKDNFGDIQNIAGEIGVAVLAWKASAAFSGLISSLFSLVTAGLIMKITWDVTTFVDGQYMQTGDPGWLVADALTNLVGSTLAGTVVGTVLGGAAGLITAGITLAVSAGISFGIAYANEPGDRANALKDLAAIKATIATLATSIGFGIATGSGLLGFGVGAVVTAPLIVLTAAVAIVVEQYRTAEEIARQAFAATGEGGISVDHIFNALQTELDRAAAGYHLVYKAFEGAADIKQDLTDVVTQVSQLSGIVRGEGRLTQDEAKAFQEAWHTVFTSFDDLAGKSFDTIFEGLNKSLTSENELIRQQARDLRVSMLMIQNQISESMAEFQVEQEALARKVASGTATSEEIQEYFDNLALIQQASHNSVTAFNDIIAGAVNIDFGDSEHAVDNAVQFIKDANAAGEKAIQEIDEGYKAEMDALNNVWSQVELAHKLKKIDDTQYYLFKSIFEQTKQNFKDEAENEKKKIKDSLQSTYKTVIDQALGGIGNVPDIIDTDGNIDVFKLSAYMTEVMLPILGGAKDAGAVFSEEYGKMFMMGINVQDWIDEGWAGKLVDYIRDDILHGEANADDVELTVPVSVTPDVGLSEWQLKDRINEAIYDADTSITEDFLQGLATQYGLDMQGLLNYVDYDTLTDAGIQKLREVVDLINQTRNMDLQLPVVESAAARPPAGIQTARGMYAYSGVNFVSKTPPLQTGTNVNTQTDLETGVTNGTARGNEAQNELLRQIIALATRIANKEFTVNITPSSAFGNLGAKSAEAYGRVTG